MTVAFIGLGSNLGDRLGTLAKAADAVEHLPFTHVVKVSHVYESRAALLEEQPDFLNAVVEVDTGMEPQDFLGALQTIEDDLGRDRSVPHKGPRTIDLDLLLFGDEEMSSDDLVLPHPGVAERDFVITPLLEIAPRITLPDGTRLRHADGVVGTVLRDLGTLPSPDADHNMPLGEVQWVEVARSESLADAVSGFDAGLLLARDVLESEGIPYAFEPFEPGVDLDPFGLPIVFKLLVPSQRAAEAAKVISAVEHAPTDFPPEVEPAD